MKKITNGKIFALCLGDFARGLINGIITTYLLTFFIPTNSNTTLPQFFAKAALTYRFGKAHQPVTETQILAPRRWQDESADLWTVYNRIQESLIKGGLAGRTVRGKRSHTRAVKGIDGDLKLNRALWVMAEELQQALS